MRRHFDKRPDGPPPSIRLREEGKIRSNLFSNKIMDQILNTPPLFRAVIPVGVGCGIKLEIYLEKSLDGPVYFFYVN